MIKELELFMTDPIVSHFKKLFEMNELLHTCRPNQINQFQIHKNPNTSYSFCNNDTYIVDEELSTIVSIIKDLMNRNGFESDDSTPAFASELHYSFTTDNGIIPDAFSIHEDDFTSIDYNVNTFILYLDVKGEGGDLVFYDRNQVVTCSLFGQCINDSIYEPFYTLDTHNPTEISCKAVIFNGSIYHKPTSILNGHRLAIVIQIPRK